MNAKLDELLLNDRGFVLDPVDGHSYQLSPTALQLVRWMQAGETDESALLERLMGQYEVEEHTASRDLDSFLNQVRELGWR